METKSNTFLETEPLGGLMKKYSIPCIISLVVAALYNIVALFLFNLLWRYAFVCKNTTFTEKRKNRLIV